MKLSFLDPLFAGFGPWASVYLDTSRDIDDADKAIDLRWRHQRDELIAQGADTATVSALATVVGAGRSLSGSHGQALFAAHGRLALAEELPEPPARDMARFDELPHGLPLAVQRAPDIPYLAIALTHSNRNPSVEGDDGGGGGDSILAVWEAGRWPTSKVGPVQRLSRQVPIEEWQRTAPEIAQETADLAGHYQAEAIVICREADETWVTGVLVNRLPDRLRNRVSVVEGDCAAPSEASAGPALLEERVGHVLEGCLSAADELQVEAFLAQRARHREKSEGITAVVTALQQGQARAILLDRRAKLSGRLWVSAEPPQIALSASELEAFGAMSPSEKPTDTALLYAAFRTGTELIVLPQGRIPLTGGVGVLLRYQDDRNTTAQ
ncbi:baeRF2 domain-containing protein [Streptomyces coelicoflavus]|uniref:baeRF2 domain-containing protein n=1 Tax=Streptomyces coelicoflavus TaxID=285562 RepID=UPI0036838F07